MNLQSLVFQRTVASSGLSRRAWGLLRRALIAVGSDPVCVMPIHGRRMRINLSHSLPLYQASHALYDALPGRLATFIRSRHGTIRGVDVGANVGDSIAAFSPIRGDHFVAIEPNAKYYARLKENWPDESVVTCLPAICSSADASGTYSILEHDGTASVVDDHRGLVLQARRLDSLLHELQFPKISIIKVDTDGSDFKVLWGAESRLRSDRPALLFECDVFDNPAFYSDARKTISMLIDCGYSDCLVYDNIGNYLGRYGLADTGGIERLLYYQLTSGCLYYDVLAMKSDDLVDFERAERTFYASRLCGVRKAAAEQFLATTSTGSQSVTCK